MPGFKFTDEIPSEQTYSDIQTLGQFNEDQLKELTEIVLTYLKQKTDLMSNLNTFAQKFSIQIPALKSTVRGVVYFFKAALKQNLSPQYLRDDLVTFGLPEDKANVVALKWKQSFIELSRTAIGQTLNVNELLDIDWRFGVTASNSDLSEVGKTFLQLKLVLNKGNKRENVHMELTIPQFYEFLHEMEIAKQNIEYFTA